MTQALTPSPNFSLGVFFPREHVVAVIHDEADAQAAEQALHGAAFQQPQFGRDGRFVQSGADVVENHARIVKAQGWTSRLGAHLPSDERDAMVEFVHQAEGGAWIAVVPVQ